MTWRANRRNRVRRTLDETVRQLGLRGLGPTSAEPIAAADLTALPEPARRWFERVGVVGRTPPGAFRVRFDGAIRLKPGQRWMPIEAWQYNTVDPIARLFEMRIVAAGVFPMRGSDRYADGAGTMNGKLFGLIPVARGSGLEFDQSELVTWVNDAVMLAPTMLLGSHCVWTDVDNRSFTIAVSDRGQVVHATVVLGDEDLPIDFVTEDRWFAGTKPPSRHQWHTPLSAWATTTVGFTAPGRGRAVWSLDDGEFTYVDGSFDPATFEIN